MVMISFPVNLSFKSWHRNANKIDSRYSILLSSWNSLDESLSRALQCRFVIIPLCGFDLKSSISYLLFENENIAVVCFTAQFHASSSWCHIIIVEKLCAHSLWFLGANDCGWMNIEAFCNWYRHLITLAQHPLVVAQDEAFLETNNAAQNLF